MTTDYMTKEHMKKEWGIDYMPGGYYKHVSLSYAERLPSWEDVKKVKEIYFGDEFVFKVLPKKEFYINAHPYCLHLFQYLCEEFDDLDQELKDNIIGVRLI